MPNLETLLANAEDAASMMLYEQGSIGAMVMLHANEGIFGMPYKSIGPEAVPLEQAIILITVRACYKAGAFKGLVLLSEAWMAKAIKGDKRMPSEREDKEEKVVLGIWDEDLKKTLAMYPILRNGPKVLMGEREKTEMDTFNSWLDDAFKD